jgi:hypothetical protein
MKKVLLFSVLILNFSTMPAQADDQVAVVTTVNDSADVLIDLPADLPAGYHSALANVTDPDTGEVTEEEINFCKDNAGEIHWDNVCPDLDILVDPTTLEKVTNVKELPKYDPVSEPEKSSQTQVAGFTALSVLSAGGAAVGAAVSGGASSGGSGTSGGSGEGGSGKSGSGANRSNSRREERHQEGSESEASEEALHAAHSKQSNNFTHQQVTEEFLGLGDRSFTWKAPLTENFDFAIIATSLRVSRFAPLLGKILIDASYLRAILGSLSFLTIPTGVMLGYLALHSNNFQPMPPNFTIFTGMAVLSLFESIGGFTAALVFAIGVLASGNATSKSTVLTTLAIAAICMAPSLIAGSFRPFRRKLSVNENFWERSTDYLLSAVLTYWTFLGFINSLNPIAGKQLAITGHAKEIGLVIGVCVILRMILEDLALYLYPMRSSKFAVTPPNPSKRQRFISNVFKAIIFGLVMESFIGLSLPLFIGTLLFILPNILKISVGHILPRSKLLHFALPKGGLRIVVMTILGTFFAKFAAGIFQDPHDFLTWGFVLLSIPGLFIALLGLVSDDSRSSTFRHHPVGFWLYRLGGAVVFYLIIQIALGKNILEMLLSLFG